MEGKACEKPVRSKELGWGEDGGEDEGDGGPSEDGRTKVCVDDVEEMGMGDIVDSRDGGGSIAGCGNRLEVEVGGGLERLGRSREKRFDVAPERPLSCSARSRSAMLPPGLLMVPASGSAREGLMESQSKFAQHGNTHTLRWIFQTASASPQRPSSAQ